MQYGSFFLYCIQIIHVLISLSITVRLSLAGSMVYDVVVKILLIFLISLFFSISCYAQVFKVGLQTTIYSTKLTGSDNLDLEGNLISNSNFFSSLDLAFGITKRLHFLVDYTAGAISFDNTKDVIAGDSEFQVSRVAAGVKFIAFSRVAFRAYFNTYDDLAFEVNESNQAIVYSEKLNYLSLFYDQIVFMGGAMYSGFKLGYDIPTSGTETTDRTGNTVGLFAVIHGFTIDYEVKSITKSNSSLDFEENINVLKLKYLFSF